MNSQERGEERKLNIEHHRQGEVYHKAYVTQTRYKVMNMPLGHRHLKRFYHQKNITPFPDVVKMLDWHFLLVLLSLSWSFRCIFRPKIGRVIPSPF